MPALQARREAYAESVTRVVGTSSPRLAAAFAQVPRERFLGTPPWTIIAPGSPDPKVTFDPADLYEDTLVVLDPARRINNGQPSLHARWMSVVEPQAGETVVQVGAGTGYYTAILAWLIGPDGRVEAYEIEPALAETARANLRLHAQVAVHAASAVGVRLPAADVVYVSAAAPAPDLAWLDALRPGGRLVMPWEPRPGRGGLTLLVRREAEGFSATPSTLVGFIPCEGIAAAAERVRADAMIATRSLWRVRDRAPDDSATAVAGEVWFSARDP